MHGKTQFVRKSIEGQSGSRTYHRVEVVIPTERLSYPKCYPNLSSLYLSIALHCSGDMYAVVPRKVPGVDADSSVGEFDRSVTLGSFARALANPKSNTLILPSGVI